MTPTIIDNDKELRVSMYAVKTAINDSQNKIDIMWGNRGYSFGDDKGGERDKRIADSVTKEDVNALVGQLTETRDAINAFLKAANSRGYNG